MYQPTIGLEIHAELKTKTKMFCGCLNQPHDAQPNKNICPICLAHPGALPMPNKNAIEAVLKVGLALNGELARISKFDRKNYFYPDLPKAYQISQYDQPFVNSGYLEIPCLVQGEAAIRIKLRRVHLEEDTARLAHVDPTISRQSASLVDFNRGGVPLMELVTEPDIKSGEEAAAFAKELQLILRYLNVSDANMEKGEMRVEANISISKDHHLGTKVEVKNLNSFRAVEEAINFEIKRQEEILERGERVVQETRGWDENKRKTFSQRLKEEAHDYRYFPEPDIPPFDLSDKNFIDLEMLKSSLSELPAQKRARFEKEYGLKPEQAEIFIENLDLAHYFEEAVSELNEIASSPSASRNDDMSVIASKAKQSQGEPQKIIQTLYNYLTSDLRGLLNENLTNIKDLKIAPENFAHLVALIENGEISSRLAKDILAEMFKTGNDPENIMKEKGLSQISDESAIEKEVEEAIAENPAALADYQKGNKNALQFLFGKTMAKLKGRGNPVKIKNILEKKLNRP